jgi:hypothetical protein
MTRKETRKAKKGAEMKNLFRKSLAILLCPVLALLPTLAEGVAYAQQTPIRSAQTLTLREYLNKSYMELFELAPKLEFSASEIESQRNSLKSGKDLCVGRFKAHSKQYGGQIDTARKDLKKNTGTLSEEQRKQVHCTIQNLDMLRSEADILSGQAIPTAYDNLSAKLDVIEQWPAQYKQIQQELASGT